MLQKFYHNTIRKGIVAFGNLFNNINIDRRDANGNVIQTLKVPLSYAPRQKFLARIETLETGSGKREVQVILPRMAFEMLSVDYDPTRRISLVQKNRTINNTSTSANMQYAPSPYNINVALYIYVKNQDDGLQILEQILPYFNPDFNLTLNSIPELGIKNDLPILLESISYDDQYEGEFTQRRAIIWTLNFTLKLNFYGPISREGVIKNVNVDFFNEPDLTEKIQTYTVTVDPANATAGNVTSFIETFEDF
jgi:hypothetical protein